MQPALFQIHIKIEWVILSPISHSPTKFHLNPSSSLYIILLRAVIQTGISKNLPEEELSLCIFFFFFQYMDVWLCDLLKKETTEKLVFLPMVVHDQVLASHIKSDASCVQHQPAGPSFSPHSSLHLHCVPSTVRVLHADVSVYYPYTQC